MHSTASAGDAGRAVSARVASGSPAASMVRRRRQRRAVPLCERGARSEHVCAAHWHLQGALAGQVIHALAMGGGQHAQGAGGPLARYDSRPTGGAVDLGAAPLLIDAPWRPCQWWGHLAGSKCSAAAENPPPQPERRLRRK